MNRPFAVAAAVAFLALVATAAPAETISQVKRCLDWTPVATSGVVTYLSPCDCYIESPDRCAGIWVQASMTAVASGDYVQVSGVVSTVDGERVIRQASVHPDGGPVLVGPLGMSCKWIGGSWYGYQDCALDSRLERVGQGYQWRWVPAMGLNNTGLLVTAIGTVTAAYVSPPNGVQWFYIDDGYKATADLGEDGVLVEYPADVEQGDLVSVTGISSVEGALDDGWRLIRAIRPRSVADVRVLKVTEEPDYCFSDEFDSAVLDPRWACPSEQQVSVTAEPGWLKMVMPENGGIGPCMGRQVGECAVQADLRLRVEFSPISNATQKVWIRKAPPPTSFPIYTGDTTLATVIRDSQGQHISVYGAEPIVMLGDTVYLQLYAEAIDPQWWVRVSLDGYTYSTAYRLQASGGLTAFWVFMTSENGSPSGAPFAVYCDYFRVTK